VTTLAIPERKMNEDAKALRPLWFSLATVPTPKNCGPRGPALALHTQYQQNVQVCDG